MTKVFRLQDLDCANCAAKMERNIQKIDGVKSASINFMAQRLTIEADESEMDRIALAAAKACKRVDPSCSLIIK